VNGAKICLRTAATPFCNAMAPPAGKAGGATWRRPDNDCDGLVDGADANCASSGLAATCALPIVRGEHGNSVRAGTGSSSGR
jgi:hypothetical protein